MDTSFDIRKPHVMTVLGPVDPAVLGVTLHHEHVICKPGDAGAADPDLLLDNPAAAVTELQDAYKAGLRAIVDMTPADYGRDIADIAWVAARSKVHIIVITGHHKHRFASPYVEGKSASEIAKRSIAELTTGIEGTGVRAGVIKAGTSLNEITEVERQVLEAAAIAHLETGAPISTHTERGTMAIEQVSMLQGFGVHPSRVVIGHLDFALDEAYLLKVLATGAYVSFDQISKVKYAPDEERAAMIVRLAAAGYLDQLLISGDLARRSYYLSYGGSPGFRYLVERFPALLMESGLSADQMRAMLVDNPAKALTVVPPGA